MDALAIRTADLRRTYKLPRERRNQSGTSAPAEFLALDNVSLEVRAGELFGLLGSNGAGKTTLIKILTTLLAPTSGSASVDGLDVISQAQGIRERINMVSGGETSGYGVLTVRENLWLFSQIYGVPRKDANYRIDNLLAAVGMSDRAHTRVSHLSTGLRQKMNFCRGFVTNPKILFLDEPTLGLDVSAARTIRQFVREWMQERPERTLVLTTHYMMEADELCDRVAVIDRGKVLACDKPSVLKRRVQRYPIFEMALTPGANGWHDLRNLPGVHQCTLTESSAAVGIKVSLKEEAVVGSVVQEVVNGGSRILSLKKVEPTLEDVFVDLVGHGLRPAEVDA
ncbi:MAG: ABC transporter ATP-binding protein [Gemmataceae bacterium]